MNGQPTEATEPALFDVVPGTTHYRPQASFILPTDTDHRRGPGPQPTYGPQDATAPAYWRAEAEAVILRLAAAGEVTADDLHAHYPHEPSATGAAIGALFRKLAHDGRLTLVGYRPSTRPQARKRVVGIWTATR